LLLFLSVLKRKKTERQLIVISTEFQSPVLVNISPGPAAKSVRWSHYGDCPVLYPIALACIVVGLQASLQSPLQAVLGTADPPVFIPMLFIPTHLLLSSHCADVRTV
jgi:hypothetical protein